MDISIKRITDYIQWHWNCRVRLEERYHNRLLTLLRLLTPSKAEGTLKVRQGCNRDGGYVMVDDLAGAEMAVSLGIGPDASWDLDIAKKGIRVLQFDHTIERSPIAHSSFTFNQLKIVSIQKSNSEITLESIVSQNREKRYLLKMDIEGDEWEILDNVRPDILEQCTTFIIELHSFSSVRDSDWYERAHRVLAKLNDRFAVIHIHGNNLSKRILLKQYCLPDSLEVSFVNRNYYTLEATNENFPGPLDRKNNPFFPNFNLGRFRF